VVDARLSAHLRHVHVFDIRSSGSHNIQVPQAVQILFMASVMPTSFVSNS